jgi:hypothetical protein
MKILIKNKNNHNYNPKFKEVSKTKSLINPSNKFLIIFFVLLNILSTIKTESVCDLELLIMELKQDLEDNGILDCLRYYFKENQIKENIIYFIYFILNF